MRYDPVKDRLGAIAARHPIFRRVFYAMLGLVFLRNWYVRRTIRRLYPDRSASFRMLDAGTGFGQWTYYVARRYPNAGILAIDVKEDYLRDARAAIRAANLEKNVRFEVGDLTTFTAEAVDFILCVDVMEHIEDDESVFANFVASLADGGHVLINTPSDLGGSDAGTSGEEGFIGEHVRPGYGRAELTGKLERAGLETVSAIYSYGLPGRIAWHMLVKWPIRWLGSWFPLVVLLPLYYLPVFPAGIVLNWLDLMSAHESGTGLHVLARRPTCT